MRFKGSALILVMDARVLTRFLLVQWSCLTQKDFLFWQNFLLNAISNHKRNNLNLNINQTSGLFGLGSCWDCNGTRFPPWHYQVTPGYSSISPWYSFVTQGYFSVTPPHPTQKRRRKKATTWYSPASALSKKWNNSCYEYVENVSTTWTCTLAIVCLKTHNVHESCFVNMIEESKYEIVKYLQHGPPLWERGRRCEKLTLGHC